MLDKNLVMLEGVSGDDVKFKRAKNGKEMCTFSLLLNQFSKELGDVDDTNSQQMIRIMVFKNKKKDLVEYLRKVNFHRGMRVSVFGRLQSYKEDYKGIAIVHNYVFVRDISVIFSGSAERIYNRRKQQPNETNKDEKEEKQQ